ncbi:MAG: DMT family transporter, partial [Anaerolineae bacterium]|nr:DMT family transporter [Anaerolineae bacterium]
TPNGGDGSRKGLRLAAFAGLCFGAFFILMGRVSEDAVFWPLTSARITALLAVLALGLVSRRAALPRRAHWPVILLAGTLDVGGNVFFVLAAQAGRLDVASVLSSLYPAVTVLLARALLKEHIGRVQALGVVAALVAIPLIAA